MKCASLLLPLLSGGCCAVAGPSKVKLESAPGLEVAHVEGYGFTALSFPGHRSLNLGWSRHTVALEVSDASSTESRGESYGIYHRLPDAEPIHVSYSGIGLQIAWEPTFVGLAFGFQSRSASSLPLDRALIFEHMPHSVENGDPRYTLKELP